MSGGLDREQIENWAYKPYTPTPKVTFDHAEDATRKPLADGGPSAYYDFPSNCVTLNDLMEWKGDTQWGGDSFHLANVTKAAWRWGIKSGTSQAYDARKLVYSGARLLMKYTSKTELRSYLLQLLEDPQFSVKEGNK